MTVAVPAPGGEPDQQLDQQRTQFWGNKSNCMLAGCVCCAELILQYEQNQASDTSSLRSTWLKCFVNGEGHA